MDKLEVIGRLERVDFPKLDLEEIDAKIDTGAYSCAIHCHDIYENEEENELCFKLLDPSHPNYNEKEIKFKNYTKTIVKSAIGSSESRFKIKTAIKIGNTIYEANFTLSDRSEMKYPVLLGRKVLMNRFLVDVSKEFLL